MARPPRQSIPGAPTPAQVKIHQIKLRAAPLLDGGQNELAVSLLEEILPLDRKDPMVHKMLGAGYQRLQNPVKAKLHLRRAADLGLDDLETMLSLASVYKEAGDFRESLRVVERLLVRLPDEPRASRFKAFLLRTLGEPEKALAWIDAVRSRVGPHPETTLLRAELLSSFKRFDEAERELTDLLGTDSITEQQRRDALFDLGAVFDKTERYDQAFASIERANQMLPEADVVTPMLFRERWNKASIERIPAADEESKQPVFVIGMPRSGTTLTEQILGAHPSVHTIGESPWMNTLCSSLTPEQLDSSRVEHIAKKYLEETTPNSTQGKQKGKPRRAERVVDKMPENYYFVPMIARSLPNAKLIHCTRDPLDTGLSCFFQNFGTRLGWTRRLQTIAAQTLLYREAMKIWEESIEMPILESNYERLTADPRPNVERLLEHIDLPFDEACLAHHKNKASVQTASVDQVRNPIYTSSQQRWKRYENHLAPLIEALT